MANNRNYRCSRRWKNTDSSSKLDVIEQESTDTPETETIKIPETTSAETAASSAESENDIETVPAVTSNETTGQKMHFVLQNHISIIPHSHIRD